MRKGFTLIELVIVLALLAGMAAITMPSIDKILKRIDETTKVNAVLKMERDLHKRALDNDDVIWDGDNYYTPFTCSPHNVEVGNFVVKIRECYIIRVDRKKE